MISLEIKGISKRFGSNKVLKDISFTVETGERRSLIGPNGAGKTTLFNIISGYSKPDEGKVLFLGDNITPLTQFQRARGGIARTFQKNNLFLGLSLGDHLKIASRGKKGKMSQNELLEQFGLNHKENEKMKNFSYGEQRQVEILLALLQNPKLVLLDEPTAGLSPVETKIITRIIGSLPRDITVLLIEHDMEVVNSISDKITVLHQGEILCEGEKKIVKNDDRVKKIYMGDEDDHVDTY